MLLLRAPGQVRALAFGAVDLTAIATPTDVDLSPSVRAVELPVAVTKMVVGLDGFGLVMVERVPIVAPARDENRRYLDTKKSKLGHLLDLGDGR